MKYAPLISLGLSVILGLTAVVLLRSGGEPEPHISQALNTETQAPKVVMVDVLVMDAPLLAGEPIDTQMVRTVSWPADTVPAGVLHSTQDLLSPSGDALIAQAPLFVGEPLLQEKLAASPPRTMLSRQITPGFRAISIRVTLETGVAGFILPGDHVDITAYAERPNGTGPDAYRPVPILQQVEVLGVDQSMAQTAEGALPASVVTLAVRSEDAARVTAAARDSRLGLSLIGQEEVSSGLEDPHPVQTVSVAVAARPSPSSVAPTLPEVRPVTVVHGTAAQTVTTPVEDTELEEVEPLLLGARS